jgi:outer membrane protein assembly factor BamB
MGKRYDGHDASRKQRLRLWRTGAFLLLLLVLLFGGIAALLSIHLGAWADAAGYSPTYLGDNGRSDFNGAESIINPTSAANLKLHWSYQAGGYISTNYISDQPVEANGKIYWGSWDGNEHATDLNGNQVWSQGLGYTWNAQCNTTMGITGTATVSSVTIGGKSTSVVFVGGGDDNFYALNAATGAIIWHTPLAKSPSDFIWGSAAVYNGNVYIGLASFDDGACPTVRGKLFELNAATGAVQHIFGVVPPGCTGGGVWGTPAIDTKTGMLFIATGNEGDCPTKETYTDSVLALRTPGLSVASSWQIPVSQRPTDSDFGSTPTLFSANIGGKLQQMVGVPDKNGMYYAFSRAFIGAGPLWKVQIAGVGGGCGPDCGDGSISPSSWDGTNLYVAGGQTSIGGHSCLGSLRALNPASGAILWADCFNNGPVLGAVSTVPGVAAVGEGNTLVLVATSNGHTLFTYADTHSGSHFYGPASISNGVLYIGNFDGLLYAFGT